MIRRYGEPVKQGQKYRRRPGVYAILLRGMTFCSPIRPNPTTNFNCPAAALIRAKTRCPHCTAR